jgi:hypothetical protein
MSYTTSAAQVTLRFRLARLKMLAPPARRGRLVESLVV